MRCEDCGGSLYRRNADRELRRQYRRNADDVNELGLHNLQNHTMWWAAQGVCDLEYVPAFRGLGSGSLPAREDPAYSGYTPGDWERIDKNWESMVRGREFLQWMEDIFDEVRREIRPEAPSRIGNALVCPKLGVGFCTQPAAWTAKHKMMRNHVYEVSATGTAITANSELIGAAREWGANPICRYPGSFNPDFYYWKRDAARMERAKSTIRGIAHEYWSAAEEDEEEWRVADGLKETIVGGAVKIVKLVLVPGGEA